MRTVLPWLTTTTRTVPFRAVSKALTSISRLAWVW